MRVFTINPGTTSGIPVVEPKAGEPGFEPGKQSRQEHLDSFRLGYRSNKYVVASVVAVAPTRRDVWAILRGRYRPKVKLVTRLTAAGLAREIKRVWTEPRVRAALNRPSFLAERMKKAGGDS